MNLEDAKRTVADLQKSPQYGECFSDTEPRVRDLLEFLVARVESLETKLANEKLANP